MVASVHTLFYSFNEGLLPMQKNKFFDERTDQSEVKARIVQKYFYVWANVIMPTAQKAGGRIGLY